MLIDTHCHLDMMVLEHERTMLQEHHMLRLDTIIAEIIAAGVGRMIMVGVDGSSCRNMTMLTQRYPQVYGSCAIHPCDCNDDSWLETFKVVRDIAASLHEHRVVAIGETGLDFYHEPYVKEHQEEAFRAHIELALACNVPVIIHSRNASEQTMNIVEPYIARGLRGVLHCFSHEKEVAQQFCAWGFSLGIGGYVTYPKNVSLRALLADVPVQHIVLETDAPFLPPQSLRGKANTPAYIPLFVPILAEIYGMAVNEFSAQTTRNACNLFSMKTL